MKVTKAIIFFTISFFFAGSIVAQTASELQATAHTFTQHGDYTNALLVLNRAALLQPNNVEITKDIAVNYYLLRDNTKALDIIKGVLDSGEADDQSFQIAGDIYKQLGLPKESEKLFKRGIKAFPQHGALYNELGEVLWEQHDYSAIKQWEKGIEVDPNYSKNYYNACKYYYLTTDNVWSILYAEVFVNMEPLNAHAAEVKEILTESYKKLFANTNFAKGNKDKSKFVAAFIETMNKQSALAGTGINTEILTMIRTRFILDWEHDNALKFPFKLFDFQKQLLQDGLFDAYNQWVFGAAENLSVYQNWTKMHAAEFADFSRLQKERMFKLPLAQYYHL